MTDSILLAIGALLLLGLATNHLGRVTKLPRVTLLLLFGVVLGQDLVLVIPESLFAGFPLITDIALLLVGFLLGGKISIESLGGNGKAVFWLSSSVVLVTLAVVFTGLWVVGVSWGLALLLAGISTATDPAATFDVVRESQSDSLFSKTLLGIVAIDDAWGLIVFSMVLTIAGLATGTQDISGALGHAVYEIGGSAVLGLALGVPMAYLTGRIKPGEPTLVEALGVVFLCGGLADYFNVSFLLSAMVLGCTVSNLAVHHERPFHAIEDIEWPFMILFFILTGASLDIEGASGAMSLTFAYIVLRIMGRAFSGWPGGLVAGSSLQTRQWIGIALLPQAGVASGMALLAGHSFPQWQQTLLSVTILSTIAFEIIGPILTRWSLSKVDE